MRDYDYKKLYLAFIRDCSNGKRRLANGNRISKGTISNYVSTFNKIVAFEQHSGTVLRLRNVSNLGIRERKKEIKYWTKFGADLLNYMTRQGFLDNYIGFHFKNIKTFHNYLKTYRNIDTGPLQNVFIVRKEEPPVIVLATDRLKYLMHNAQFRSLLSPNLVSSLDMFIFGCCTGLRFSDLSVIRKNNLELQNNSVYLVVRSKKTKIETRIKLPLIAFDKTSLSNFISSGNHKQVTKTYYDEATPGFSYMSQDNLRKRVSGIEYFDDASSTVVSGVYYTYDIHGNVLSLVRRNEALGSINSAYTRTDYSFDLISSKVNQVDYQKNQLDWFIHRYEYDADNRITDVYSSNDNTFFDHDASYFYYLHGPLSRVEY
jgi:site-specific recombinase XerD